MSKRLAGYAKLSLIAVIGGFALGFLARILKGNWLSGTIITLQNVVTVIAIMLVSGAIFMAWRFREKVYRFSLKVDTGIVMVLGRTATFISRVARIPFQLLVRGFGYMMTLIPVFGSFIWRLVNVVLRFVWKQTSVVLGFFWREMIANLRFLKSLTKWLWGMKWTFAKIAMAVGLVVGGFLFSKTVSTAVWVIMHPVSLTLIALLAWRYWFNKYLPVVKIGSSRVVTNTIAYATAFLTIAVWAVYALLRLVIGYFTEVSNSFRATFDLSLLKVLAGILVLVLFTWIVVRWAKKRTPQPVVSTQAPTQPQQPVTVRGRGFGWGWVESTVVVAIVVALLWSFGYRVVNPLSGMSAGRTISATNVYYPPGKPSFEIVHPILSGCESGDGTPGSGKQFVVDKDGKQIPHRNPTKPGVVGYLQINTDDTANAKIIADHKWDVVNKKEDNLAMGEFLYDNYDTVPWTASEPCWRPLYDNLRVGLKRYELKIVEAKPREWSESYQIPTLPPGSRLHAGSIDGAPYYYMANGDDCLVKKGTENLPRDTVVRGYAFASKESPTKIRIYYTTP